MKTGFKTLHYGTDGQGQWFSIMLFLETSESQVSCDTESIIVILIPSLLVKINVSECHVLASSYFHTFQYSVLIFKINKMNDSVVTMCGFVITNTADEHTAATFWVMKVMYSSKMLVTTLQDHMTITIMKITQHTV
jgi:hypothetical protein